MSHRVSCHTINAIEYDGYDPLIEPAFKLANYVSCGIADAFDPGLKRT